MEWVASILHTTSEHGVSSITTADARSSAANIRLNWRPRRFKWTRPFCRKTKSGFCACAITFQQASSCNENSLGGRRVPCANPGHQAARTNKCFMLKSNICGFSVWGPLHVTSLTPGILMLRLVQTWSVVFSALQSTAYFIHTYQ
jgi:hypothetical protein